jgi:CSLREA domain-containing protein
MKGSITRLRRRALAVALELAGSLSPGIVAPARPALAIQTTLSVTKTADTNDGACSPDDCSLREAIIAANAMANAAVDVPAGT